MAEEPPMQTSASGLDRGVGLAVALGVVALGGALVTFNYPDAALAGWGFAVAVTAATLAVVAVQVYG